MSKDCLHKYLVLDRQARVITVYAKDVVNEYINNVHPTPVASAAMGRLLCATLMMGSTLKGKESIMVSIDGNGPIGVLKAESNCNGDVRGFVSNPYVDLPLNDKGNLDVAKAVGQDGFINVTKQLNMKEPFVGSCNLISGEIGEDISYYYGMSEQTPTVVALGILIDKDHSCKVAGGFMIQMLPKASEEAYEEVEKLVYNIKSVSNMLEKVDGDSSKIIDLLFKEKELILENDVRWHCDCSYEKALSLLSHLKKEELEEEISHGGADVTCNFCQKSYHINVDDISKLVKEK